MRFSYLTLLLCLVYHGAFAQQKIDSPLYVDGVTSRSESDEPVYARNWWVSGSILLTGTVTNHIFLPKIKAKAPTSVAELPSRGEADVSAFNSWALEQNPNDSRRYHRMSDFVFNGATILPFALLLDEEIRHDWLDFGLLYLETYALNGMLYSIGPGSPQYIDRFRPVVYYPEAKLETRTDGQNRNSFYSGHVATIAAATFFTAKVYADYHPELGTNRYFLYGLALIPPAASAVMRVKALKHFPTDTVVGGLIGIGTGLLIPTLHKNWLRRDNGGGLAIRPSYQNDFKGAALSWRF